MAYKRQADGFFMGRNHMEKFYRCLIVEDELYSANLISNYLKIYKQFYTPRIVQTCSDAVREIKSTNFDLIFCDIHLPDGNSIDLIKSLSIRSPVVLISGDKNQSLKAYDLDVIDYVVKPVSRDRFNKTIEKLLVVIEGRKQLSKEKNGHFEEINNNKTLETILSHRYNLSPTECALCRSIKTGKNMDDILASHSITRNTYKTHMKKIFAKTIDFNNPNSSHGQGKLRDLTIFLLKLEKEGQ
jgi:response regulator of citrate/malate metabolism